MNIEQASGPVLAWLGGNWGWVVAVFALFFEITPIKIHPISSLVNWIGRAITKDVASRIISLQKEVRNLQRDVMENRRQHMEDEKDRIRFEVLNFANSCRNHQLHTKDEFMHIIAVNDKYEKLLKETNDTNGVFKEEYNYIVSLYKKCQIENDFLV